MLGVEGHCMWLKRGFNLLRLLTVQIAANHKFQDKEPAWQAAVAPGYTPKGCTQFPSMGWWGARWTWLLSPCLPLKGSQPTGVTEGRLTKLTPCPSAVCSRRSGDAGRVSQPSCSLHCHLRVTKRQARSCHWVQTSWLGNCTYAQAVGMAKEAEMRLWVSRRGQGTKPLGNWMALWLRAVSIRKRMM